MLPHAAINLRPRGRGGGGWEGRGKEGEKRVEKRRGERKGRKEDEKKHGKVVTNERVSNR